MHYTFYCNFDALEFLKNEQLRASNVETQCVLKL